MNHEILEALYLVHQTVVEQYDEIDEEAIDNNVEVYNDLGSSLDLVFEYLLQQEQLLELKELEASQRNK
jgi:hypothetical protein